MNTSDEIPAALAPIAPRPTPRGGSRWARVWREETGGFDFRLWVADALLRLLPCGACGRVRAALYRRAGIRIGAGSIVAGRMTFGAAAKAHAHVRIGARCFINRAVYVDAAAAVTIGDGVSIGHHVVVITTDHAIGPPEFRAGALRPAPVTVGDGAWVAAGVTLLPGVTVGAGAVVAAGAVVTRDVPPNVLAGGVPARVLRELSVPDASACA